MPAASDRTPGAHCEDPERILGVVAGPALTGRAEDKTQTLGRALHALGETGAVAGALLGH